MREGRGQPQSGRAHSRPGLEAGRRPLRLHPSAPPPARSRTSPEPVPYTAKRGEGRGPPHTAALRHESPPPPGTLGPGRGAHSLYLAGLDLILPRGGLQSLQPPQPQSPPWSHLVWFGGRGSSFLLSVSTSFLPTVVRLKSFPTCLPFLCPVVVSSPSDRP